MEFGAKKIKNQATALLISIFNFLIDKRIIPATEKEIK